MNKHFLSSLSTLTLLGLVACGPRDFSTSHESKTSLPGAASPAQEETKAYLKHQMAAFGIPGMTVALAYGGKVVWQTALGVADIDNNVPMTEDHLFYTASSAKTITATAMMQLFEADRRLSLDDDVNLAGLLPFRLVDVNFPTTAVTYRQLLTHTSGISDHPKSDDYVVRDKDSPLSMQSYLGGYFAPGGAYYDTANWSHHAPGTAWEYSNVGASVLGYLTETMTGQGFDAYCEEHIFAPLGMHATWKLAGLPSHAPLAQGYSIEAATGKLVSVGHWGQDPLYPSGGMQANAGDFAAFAAMMGNKGVYKDRRVLQAATVDSVSRVQLREVTPHGKQGLIWVVLPGSEPEIWYHAAGFPGFGSGIAFRPADGAGAVVLFNADAEGLKLEAMIQKLVDAAPGTPQK